MQARNPHPWPQTKAEAHRLQEAAAQEIRLMPLAREPRLIAAVETVYGSGGDMLYGCGVIMTFPELREVERVFGEGPPGFPYVPGLLYFREGAIVGQVLNNFAQTPDLLIIHGHGTAHPTRCGLACQVGVVFDVPTIGCSRRLLTGHHREVPETKGSSQPIMMGSRQVGVAFRSKDNVKPIFVSPGHLCDLPGALDIVKRCLRGFRQPEPLRLAHRMANKYKRRCEKRRRPGG